MHTKMGRLKAHAIIHPYVNVPPFQFKKSVLHSQIYTNAETSGNLIQNRCSYKRDSMNVYEMPNSSFSQKNLYKDSENILTHETLQKRCEPPNIYPMENFIYLDNTITFQLTGRDTEQFAR